MRSFLYLSPYFPPVAKVGALRPLKFVRHLPGLGWRPLVLCDQTPADRVERELVDAIPPEVEVDRSYGVTTHSPVLRSIVAWWNRPSPAAPPSAAGSAAPTSAAAPHSSTASAPSRLVSWNPEWIPLGRHSIDLGHARRHARRILREARPDAIVVNADPYATLLLGAELSREFSLPLISDLRDPWGPCELRRPLRPTWQRASVDRRERRVIDQSSFYILNTDVARDAYQRAHPDVAPDKFVTLRNHADPDLTAGGAPRTFPHRTILFLGGFRRFVSSETILRALSVIKREEVERLELRIFGSLPPSEVALAAQWGVLDRVHVEPAVPYTQVGSLLAAADLLLSRSHTTAQRIPAKLYDYLTAHRPILHVGHDNPELEAMFASTRGVTSIRGDDVEGVVAELRRCLQRPRRPEVERDGTEFSSRRAAEKLAQLLDAATSGR